MNDDRRFEELLDRDWGDAWENLPAAPPLVLRQPKSAQVTLRIPRQMLAALKGVAARRALPYHALGRSWVVEGLRQRQVPPAGEEVVGLSAPSDAQLNLKMTPDLLADIQAYSHEVRIPYHRLARFWLDVGLRRELAAMASSSRDQSTGK